MVTTHKCAVICSLIVTILAGCTSSSESTKIPVADSHDEKKEYYERSKSYLESKDYTNALINILKAERSEGDEQLDQEIELYKSQLFDKLNTRVVSDTDMNITIGEGMDENLQYMVFYMEDETIYPVFNMPVYFSVEKGTANITEKAFTNTNGIAECGVGMIEKIDNNELVIKAGISITIEGQNVRLEAFDQTFAFQYRGIEELSIVFITFEKNMGKVNKNTNRSEPIVKHFISNGFTVANSMSEIDEERFLSLVNGESDTFEDYKSKLDSQMVGLINIESEFSSQIDDEFFFAKGKVFLNLILPKNNKLLYTASIRDVKGAGNTIEKAGEEAMNEAVQNLLDILKIETEKIRKLL